MADPQPAAAELEKLKKEADAQRELIEARAKTQTAAFKALFGDVPSSGIQGSVETKDRAGVTEAALLAGRAVGLAAQQIAADLTSSDFPTCGTVLLLFAAADAPSFNGLLNFRAQQALLRQALADATRISIESHQRAPMPTVEVVPSAAAVGMGLDAASRLLGFFRSDFSIGGVQLTVDDSMLVHALAGNPTLRQKYVVRLPAQYNPQALANPADGILQDLIALAALRAGNGDAIDRHERAQAHFLTASAAASAQIHQAALAALKGANALYDAFFTGLTTADDKGSVPLSAIAREEAVARDLDSGAALLVVKLQTAGGAHYTRKSLWTFFGWMPFYNMGGVVASYVLLSGREGDTLRSGVVPIHGGFFRSSRIQRAVEREAAPSPSGGAVST